MPISQAGPTARFPWLLPPLYLQLHPLPLPGFPAKVEIFQNVLVYQKSKSSAKGASSALSGVLDGDVPAPWPGPAVPPGFSQRRFPRCQRTRGSTTAPAKTKITGAALNSPPAKAFYSLQGINHNEPSLVDEDPPQLSRLWCSSKVPKLLNNLLLHYIKDEGS